MNPETKNKLSYKLSTASIVLIPLDKKYNSERIKVSDQTEVEIISIIKKLEISGGKEIESLTLVLKNLSI